MKQKELKLEVTLNHKTVGILRKIKGVTVNELADRMHVHVGTLKKAECSQVAISPMMNVRLWKALTGIGYSVEAIFVINEFVEHFGGVTGGTN